MSSWGAVSLDQQLPEHFFSVPVAWAPPPQPAPRRQFPLPMGSADHLEAGNEVLHAPNNLLQSLEQSYILESPEETRSFLRLRRMVTSLLVEASAHINESFGEVRIRAVRLVRDDSGVSVFGIIFWPDSIESGEQALARFDEAWWLRNCARAGAILNFNIELV